MPASPREKLFSRPSARGNFVRRRTVSMFRAMADLRRQAARKGGEFMFSGIRGPSLRDNAA